VGGGGDCSQVWPTCDTHCLSSSENLDTRAIVGNKELLKAKCAVGHFDRTDISETRGIGTWNMTRMCSTSEATMITVTAESRVGRGTFLGASALAAGGKVKSLPHRDLADVLHIREIRFGLH